jgi:cobalt-zinc-cadmium efflux system outer membrane protein
VHDIGRAAAAARDRRSPGRNRRREQAWLWALLWGLALGPTDSRAQEPRKVDLRAAIDLARRNNPAFEAARRRVDEARGELTGAGVVFRENPEAEVGYGRRRLEPGAGGNRDALDASIAQRLEIAGQRGKRIERAGAELAAAEADAEAARRALDIAVAAGFYAALGAAERRTVADENEGLARALLAIAEAREARGAISPLEANGARVRLAEASRQVVRPENTVAGSRGAQATTEGRVGPQQRTWRPAREPFRAHLF